MVINFLKPSCLQLELLLLCYSLGPRQKKTIFRKTQNIYNSYHVSLELSSTIHLQTICKLLNVNVT